MPDTFTVVESIFDPATPDDFEKAMRTMLPTSQLVDDSLMKVSGGKLLPNSYVPRMRKATITYEDFTVAGLSEAVAAQVLQAGEIILKAVLDVTDAWVIAGMSTLDLELGVAADPDKYSGSTHVGGEAVSRGNVFDPPANDGLEDMTASTEILLTATSDAGNLADATAGSVDVYLVVVGTIKG